MSRWIRFAAAAVLAVAMVACGANGGDPVARRQIPAGQADPSQASESGGSAGTSSGDGGSGGSDQGGSGGGGTGSGDHDRKVGLPESIRIKEIGPEAFVASVVAACGSKDGAPDCLIVNYLPVTDPDQCSFGWQSTPPKVSTPEGTDSIVQRGAKIDVTICPPPAETTSPAAEETTSPAPDGTMSPAPDDNEMSTSDSPSP